MLIVTCQRAYEFRWRTEYYVNLSSTASTSDYVSYIVAVSMTQLNSPSSSRIEQTVLSFPIVFDPFQVKDQTESSDFDSPQSDGSTLKIDSKTTKRGIDSPDACNAYETIDKLDFVQFGVPKGVQERFRKIYSTTSSVYAEHTISNPNTEQLLFW